MYQVIRSIETGKPTFWGEVAAELGFNPDESTSQVYADAAAADAAIPLLAPARAKQAAGTLESVFAALPQATRIAYTLDKLALATLDSSDGLAYVAANGLEAFIPGLTAALKPLVQNSFSAFRFGDIYPGHAYAGDAPPTGVTCVSADQIDIVWPAPFADIAYTVHPQATGTHPEDLVFSVSNKTADGCTLNLTESVGRSQNITLTIQATA